MTTTNPGWGDIEPLISGPDQKLLVARLGELDDVGRKALVKPLRAYARSGEFEMAPRGSGPGLSVVGVAVLPDARSTAAWLRRFPASWTTEGAAFDERPGTPRRVVRTLLERHPKWLPALIAQLAERLRFSFYDRGPFEVVDGLRQGLGMAPPQTPGFAALWLYRRWPARPRSADGTRVDALEAEPAAARLVPLLFDEDAVAFMLREEEQFARVLSHPLVERTRVLDAALSRLQRGGRPQAGHDFVQVLRALGPTPDEVAARLEDHLALLAPGCASTAAGYAQAVLFDAHEAGLVSSSDLIRASRSVLARSEKKLLRAQLAWLERHVRSHPDDAPDVVAAVQVAAGGAADIARRAEELIGSLGASPPQPDVAELPESPDPPDPAEPSALHGIADVDGAVEVLLTLLRSTANHTLGLEVDLLLEALPRLAGPDGSELRRARSRFDDEIAAQHLLRRDPRDPGPRVLKGIAAVVATLLGDDWDDWEEPEPANPRQLSIPDLVVVRRAYDLARTLRADRRVRVVSLPTDDSGAISPQVLAERLRLAAEAGWAPASLDLEQARLRAEPDLWPTPVLDVVQRTFELHDPDRWPSTSGRFRRRVTRIEVEATTGPHGDGGLWSLLVAEIDEHPWGSGWQPETFFAAWPTVLPHHPGVIAAHLIPELSRAATSRCQGLGAFVRLAESPVSGGPAMALSLAHLLNGGSAEARAAAVDGLLARAARGDLDGAQVGGLLAAMIARREVTPSRLPGPLGEAVRAGAPIEVWHLLRRLLGDLLDTGDPVPGFADLLTCAADAVAYVADPSTVPGLEAFAARPGRSRQLVEARRLVDLLGARGVSEASRP